MTMLTTDRLCQVLNSYAEGELSGKKLSAWARKVHRNSDIVLDSLDHELLAQALLELAAPRVFGNLPTVVKDLQVRLSPHCHLQLR